MEKKKNDGNGMPLLIIGAVFLVVFIGGWWLYSSSKSKPKPAVSGGNDPVQTVDNYSNAAPGAQPPHMLGSPTAGVTIEEFADFQCPTCASVHTVMKQTTSAYGSRIRFVFRNYPLPIPAHDKAFEAAIAAEAAGLQGKFWDMQNLLFTNQATWSASAEYRKLFAQYAGQIGLDVEKFNTDILALPAKSRVNDDVERARSLKVSSTPTVYVNGIQIPHTEVTPEGLRRIIDIELRKADMKNQPAGGNTQKPAENK